MLLIRANQSRIRYLASRALQHNLYKWKWYCVSRILVGKSKAVTRRSLVLSPLLWMFSFSLGYVNDIFTHSNLCEKQIVRKMVIRKVLKCISKGKNIHEVDITVQDLSWCDQTKFLKRKWNALIRPSAENSKRIITNSNISTIDLKLIHTI